MPPVSLQRVYSSCLLLTWPVSCVNIYLTPADEPGTQRKPHTEVMTFEGRENPSVLSAEAPPQSLFLEGLWGRGCVFDEEPPLSPCSGSLFFLVAGCHLQPLPPPQGGLFTVLFLDGCLHIDPRAPGAACSHAGPISHPLCARSSRVSQGVAVCRFPGAGVPASPSKSPQGPGLPSPPSPPWISIPRPIFNDSAVTLYLRAPRAGIPCHLLLRASPWGLNKTGVIFPVSSARAPVC